MIYVLNGALCFIIRHITLLYFIKAGPMYTKQNFNIDLLDISKYAKKIVTGGCNCQCEISYCNSMIAFSNESIRRYNSREDFLKAKAYMGIVIITLEKSVPIDVCEQDCYKQGMKMHSCENPN